MDRCFAILEGFLDVTTCKCKVCVCIQTVTSPHRYKADKVPGTIGGTEQHLINVFSFSLLFPKEARHITNGIQDAQAILSFHQLSLTIPPPDFFGYNHSLQNSGDLHDIKWVISNKSEAEMVIQLMKSHCQQKDFNLWISYCYFWECKI